MESSLKKLNKYEGELTVEIGREELTAYVKEAEDSIIKNLEMDGFRKGKVPKEVMREKVGEQYILEAALDMALKDSLAKAIEKSKTEVLKVAKLDVKENSKEKVVYKVSLTLFPEVKLADLDTIKIKRKDIVVENKEVEESLEIIRSSRAKLSDKSGAIEKGDKVEVDFEVYNDGKIIEGGSSKNHPIMIGAGKFIPGFEDNLVGLKKEEEKEFSLNIPDNYFSKDIAGKMLDFKVKIVSVKKVDMPELNDEFAKGLGQFNGVVNLKESIREGISKEKKIKERQKERLEILARLTEKSEVDAPAQLIEDRVDEMIVGFDEDLHRKGMELSIYLARINKTQDDLKKEWMPEAERHVKYSLVLRKLAKDNNIVVSPEEIEELSKQKIQAIIMSGQATVDNINVEEIKEVIAGEILNERTFSLIEGRCLT